MLENIQNKRNENSVELLNTPHGEIIVSHYNENFKEVVDSLLLSNQYEKIITTQIESFMNLEDSYVKVGYERSGALELAQKDIFSIIEMKVASINMLTAV